MSNQSKKVIVEDDDPVLDLTLRPKTFADYIGQKSIVQNLQILIQAAKTRQDMPDHVLLYGPPGLGKTTLAGIIAHELGANIISTSGPALERTGDLASLLSSLENQSIIFIDEIHRLPQTVEEMLYLAMEDQAIDIVLGKGPSAKTLRLDIPPFTLIGATTKIGNLSNPFRDRFGIISRLEFYSVSEITQIIKRSSQVLKLKIDEESLNFLASRSRMTPRIANRLLKRVRDLATIKQIDLINLQIATEALEILEIDHHGLDKSDRKLLELLIEKYQGGPAGLKSIAASLAEDINTIEDFTEPYLLRSGFLKRTARGRMVTDKAYIFFKNFPE